MNEIFKYRPGKRSYVYLVLSEVFVNCHSTPVVLVLWDDGTIDEVERDLVGDDKDTQL